MNFKHAAPVFVPIVLLFLSSTVFWNSLPDQLPIHMTSSGIPDSFSSKGRALFGLPFLYCAIVILVAGLDRLSQRYFRDRSSISPRHILFAIGLVFLVIQSNIIAYGLGASSEGFAMGQLVLGFIYIVLGMFIKSIDRNRWVGIRLPWTLSSNENWRLTHDLWGKLLIAIGYLSILMSSWSHDASLAVYSGILSVLLAIAYSAIHALLAKTRKQ